MTTLIIGASGSVGRHVLDELRGTGHPVRASVRSLASADLPPEVQVVEVDMTRPETLGPAMDGVQRAFVYAHPEGAAHVVEAASRAGVEHVVVLSSGSVLLADQDDNAITVEHREVERVFAGSSLRWTPVRPLVLAANALNWAYGVRETGVVRLPKPEARTAPIHERDIASVAVAALLGTALSDPSAMLTGPDLLTQREQVDLIGRATGRDIDVEALTPDRAREHLGRFEGPEVVEAILAFVAGAALGRSPATGAVREILGRHPIDFGTWAQEHVVEFTQG